MLDTGFWIGFAEAGYKHPASSIHPPARHLFADVMSPEQAAGKHSALGRRGRVFARRDSLSNAHGRSKFQVETLHSTCQVQARSGRAAVVIRRPVDLQTICLKCLEKEPAKRFQSAAELADGWAGSSATNRSARVP